jgi:2-C-methyl-D-erythritol 4-phosphate cytidylyltransferase
MGSEQRKPFLKIDGTPILLHTLTRFSALDECTEIVLVVHPDDLSFYRKKWASKLESYFGVKRIVAGGQSRQKSVRYGIEATTDEHNLVLVHDAVRPFVKLNVIRNVAAKAASHDGAIAAVPAIATIKEVNGNNRIIETPPRDNLWMAQTPQGFPRSILIEAHKTAKQSGTVGTDDAGLVEALGYDVYVVEDSRENMKITIPGDMSIAHTILQRQVKRNDPGALLDRPGTDAFPTT